MLPVMPAASVILPARDAAATLPRALSALKAQQLNGGFEVLVVDDGSSDSTAAIAESAGAPVRCIRVARAGPAAARNAGVAAADAEFLAFTDADCFPAPGWLDAGVRALGSADLVQGLVVPDPEAQVGPYDRSLWIDRRSGLWETANLFVRRESFERVGGFEEWLTPRVGKAMGEDVWLGWRLVRDGARTAFCPDAVVHHAVFAGVPAGYVEERRRLEHFPEMVRRMPELRGTLCWNRLFLSRRSAAFDVAVAGLMAAAITRRVKPLAAVVPYAASTARRARPYGPAAPSVASVYAVADAVGLLALLRGSVSARSLLL